MSSSAMSCWLVPGSRARRCSARDGLLSQVTKAVLERPLGEELTAHLGYERHDPAGRGSGNSGNGVTGKRLLTEIGGIDLEVPRDGTGSFSPQMVRRGQTRLDGFNDPVIAPYARGMTTRDIRAHLREMSDVEVSADLISRVTDVVVEELQDRQAWPLDRVYPVVFVDALMVKIRGGLWRTGRSIWRSGSTAMARRTCGLWVRPATGESSKFWLTVLSELKSRGVAEPVQRRAHDFSLATADNWLRAWIPKLMAGPHYTSGRVTIIITFDEDDSSQGNKVPFVVIDPHVAGKSVTATFNHHSLTRRLASMRHDRSISSR
jgi:hypothetical protein